MKRWVVTVDSTWCRPHSSEAGDVPSRTIEDVLAAMNEAPSAIAQGRVFLGRKRVVANYDVRVGDEISVYDARSTDGAGTAELLFDGDGLVVAAKPSGMPTISDHRGHEGTLVAWVARAAHLDPSSLHPTSRLDRDVSGVVIFTTSDLAREHLTRARDAGEYQRRYVGITTSMNLEDAGVWSAPIGRTRDPRLRKVNGKDAIPAETRFRVASRAKNACMLTVTPITGRTHQIRVHASHAGAPLLGDSAYGGRSRVVSATGAITELTRIGLHCAWVSVPSMTKQEPVVFEAPIAEELREAWRWLGGADDAWVTALE